VARTLKHEVKGIEVAQTVDGEILAATG
jgi:hypothetical protein